MKRKAILAGSLALLCCTLVASVVVAGGKWSARGTYVEGCSCMGVCPCSLTGLKDGCEGVGAFTLSKGSSYMGVDLGGAKVAYATTPGKWIRLYIDAKDPQVNKATREFASAAFADWGKLESVTDVKIDIAGDKGKYTVQVDDGKIMKLVTEPVLGGDKKTPIAHTNINDPLNSSVMQGKTVSGSYKDGDKSMTLEGSNSYFNPHMNSNGLFQ